MPIQYSIVQYSTVQYRIVLLCTVLQYPSTDKLGCMYIREFSESGFGDDQLYTSVGRIETTLVAEQG